MSENKIDPEKFRKAQEAKRIIDMQTFELELKMMPAKVKQNERFLKEYGHERK